MGCKVSAWIDISSGMPMLVVELFMLLSCDCTNVILYIYIHILYILICFVYFKCSMYTPYILYISVCVIVTFVCPLFFPVQ